MDSVLKRQAKKDFFGQIPHLFPIVFLALSMANCGGGGSSSSTTVLPGTSPTIISINPSTVLAGADAFTLTVNGNNFASGAKIRLNGLERPTTFISPLQVKADVPMSDVAAAGSVKVMVANPPPNEKLSNEVNLAVNNPVPVLTSCNPTSAIAGSDAIDLILYGENFVSGSAVQFGASTPTAAFISSSRLTINLTANDLANSGNVAIHVTNPVPGGGTSNDFIFNIAPSGLFVLTKSLPAASPGKQYEYTLQAGGGKDPYLWALASGSLPSGLNLDSDGTISGTPFGVPSDLHFGFTVQATDSVSSSALQPLDILARSSKLGRNDVCGSNTASQISNGVIRASISPYGDIDVYSFQASAGARVSVEIRAQRLSLYGNSSSRDIFLDSFLEILDSNCNRIDYNDDIELGIIQDSAISGLYVPAAGVYYIRVSDLRGDGRPDFIYELELSGAE